MRIILTTAGLCIVLLSFCQLTPENFGYRHQTLIFRGDTVHILISSKIGEEEVPKPIIMEIQGSTGVPLIVHDGENMISSVSILKGLVEDEYHLVMVNKPGIPLMCHHDELRKRRYKIPGTNKYPEEYVKHNNLDYYVERNNEVVKYLKKQVWVDSSQFIIEGHSEGSTIATHMADRILGITHLIYSGGLPYYPRILAMIRQERQLEYDTINPWVQKSLDYWTDVIKQPLSSMQENGWDTKSETYSFSQSENEVLKRLHIPVLISFGTQDEAAPFNDMFHIEVIKDRNTNIQFKSYLGLDHYYQSTSEQDFIPMIVKDWLDWLDAN